MAYGHTFADDVKPMWQNRSENFAIYMGTKVNSFQAFEFLFQQVVAESQEELRAKAGGDQHALGDGDGIDKISLSA